MKILIDRYIPFLDGVLDPYAEVLFLDPEDFTPERVHDADALFIRTRTRIDATLLEGSRVRFVATATIGYDHIDTAYCEAHHICWTNCPGCNAQAVCDYIEEALREIATCSHRNLIGTSSEPHRNLIGTSSEPYRNLEHTLGVVGVGHVGSKVAVMAERMGLRVLLNDPPKHIGISLSEIAEQCDIITFHTPLDSATCHLCDADFLHRCKPDALIINAARGGIVDEQALLTSGHPCVIDCWENEPHINPTLASSSQTLLASYHIAGYSLDGKRNASQMCLDAFCTFFDLPSLKCQEKSVTLQSQKGDSADGWLQRITDRLKAAPDQFEQLRKQYILR